MRRFAPIIAAAAAVTLLSGCAYDHYTRAGYVAAEPYDVYYDGFYGPYPGGYWGPDAFFYFSDVDGFRRDEGRHFQHQRFARAQGFRSSPPAQELRSRERRGFA